VLGILRVRIWYAFTFVPPLAAAVLWLGAASFDSFRDPAYHDLCDSMEAFMEIEPHFNLSNYFFHVWLRPGSDTEAVVWGCVDIYIQTGQGVNPYFILSMSNPLVGWQKEWIFLWNDADAPLAMFIGNFLIPQPSWGMVWLGGTFASYNPCTTLSSSCNEPVGQAQTSH
jgi:hypothetical protein